MSDYLRSNCDTGFMTVWSELLKCTMDDSWGFFYKDFCGSDVIYVHLTSFVMSLELESHDPKCYHLVKKINRVSFKLLNFNCMPFLILMTG